MSKSAVSGPLFGAKQLLWSISNSKGQGSSVAVTLGAVVVPAGEDWYVTDFHVYRGSTESTGSVFALVDDSTTVADVAITSSLAGVAGSTRPAKDGGEFAGTRVVTGSSVSITANFGGSTLASTGIQAWVYGYPRWLQSDTRGV